MDRCNMNINIRFVKEITLIFGALISLPSEAEPIRWTLNFFDGEGTLVGSGSFNYDPDTIKCVVLDSPFECRDDVPNQRNHTHYIDTLSITVGDRNYHANGFWWNESSVEPATGSMIYTPRTGNYSVENNWTVWELAGYDHYTPIFRMQDFIPTSSSKWTGAWSSYRYNADPFATDLPPSLQSGSFTATLTSSLTKNYEKSYFDGAGSIIQTSINCWGCDKDEARMHPHTLPSTILFQWTAEENCPYLKISSPNDQSLEVNVHSKQWNDDLPRVAYQTTLPLTVDKIDYWNITAITSQRPLSSEKVIIAECTDSAMPSDRTYIEPIKPVLFNDDFDWGGNGSIISKSASGIGTGVIRDWAHRKGNPDYQQYTIFQWQSSERCQSLKLDDTRDSITVTEVDMKHWRSAKWTEKNLCDGLLPCTVTASIDSYQIIRIRTKAGEGGSDTIQASCQ